MNDMDINVITFICIAFLLVIPVQYMFNIKVSNEKSGVVTVDTTQQDSSRFEVMLVGTFEAGL